MKRLHNGPVDRVEESRHFGLGSSFNSIDSDQWHGVILLFCIPSRILFLDPRECRAATGAGQDPAREVPSFLECQTLRGPVAAPIRQQHLLIRRLRIQSSDGVPRSEMDLMCG